GADTNPGYLTDKLVAGSGVTITLNNPGGDESLTLSAGGGVTAVHTAGSVVGGTITGSGTITLDGDDSAPRNSMYYGTGSVGVKGFHDFSGIPAGAGGVDQSVQWNDSGTLNGDTTFIYDSSSGQLSITATSGYAIHAYQGSNTVVLAGVLNC